MNIFNMKFSHEWLYLSDLKLQLSDISVASSQTMFKVLNMLNYSLSRRVVLKKIALAMPAVGTLTSLPFNTLSQPFLFSLVNSNHTSQRNAILNWCNLGFNGEIKDSSDGYLLGNGYRSYRPGLQRFMSPDSLSPFGEAGVNTYVYSSNNPINRFDPSGHLDIGTFFFGLGALIVGLGGIIAAPFTGGTSLAVGAGVAAGVFGTTSGSLKMIDSAVENETTSKNLAIASSVFGLAQAVTSSVGAVTSTVQKSSSIAQKGYKTESKLVKTKSRYKSDPARDSEKSSDQYVSIAKNKKKKVYTPLGSSGFSVKTKRADTIGTTWKSEVTKQTPAMASGLLSFGGGINGALTSTVSTLDEEATEIRASPIGGI
ncbi:RHS repeat-associated core domain-containing protein [Vibrio navarrensis]|nr:RHS repeat-associated core domain-containing protein [Vibrio navarrensis]